MSAPDAAAGRLPARGRAAEPAAKAAAAKKKKYLSIGALAMINVAAVLSLRNFPTMARYDWALAGAYSAGQYQHRQHRLFRRRCTRCTGNQPGPAA